MISKRKLLKYRKEALFHAAQQNQMSSGGILGTATESESYIKKVLELTQELIDQHLLKEGK